MFIEVAAVSLAIGVVTTTVSKAKIFAPLRHWMEYTGKMYWLADMIGCPYCFSHWVAAFAQAWFQFTFTTSHTIVDLIIGWLILTALGNVVPVAIVRGYHEAKVAA